MSHLLFDAIYGGVPGRDRHDSRDFLFALNANKFNVPLVRPTEVDFRNQNWVPPIYDQGRIGSCTGWSVKTDREILSLRTGHALQPLSALWAYYEGRRKYWDVDVDSGLYMREIAKILAGRGIALEAEWPNDNAKWNVQPPAFTYQKALWYRNVYYYRIQTLGEMLDCLASGHPFIFGFPIYSNFYREAAGSGNVPMPKGLILGGHAQCTIGYKFDDAWPGGGYILARNSWGDWTFDGNLRFPFAFMQDSDVVWDVWTFWLRSDPEQPPFEPGPQ